MGFNKNLFIVLLIIVVLVLMGVLAYVFAIKPSINSYVVEKQKQGMDYVLAVIVQQIQQKGYVEIPIGNQTLILVPAKSQNINSNPANSPDSG